MVEDKQGHKKKHLQASLSEKTTIWVMDEHDNEPHCEDGDKAHGVCRFIASSWPQAKRFCDFGGGILMSLVVDHGVRSYSSSSSVAPVSGERRNQSIGYFFVPNRPKAY